MLPGADRRGISNVDGSARASGSHQVWNEPILGPIPPADHVTRANGDDTLALKLQKRLEEALDGELASRFRAAIRIARSQPVLFPKCRAPAVVLVHLVG